MTTTFLNVSGQTLSVNYGLATPQTIASPGVLIVPDAVALNYSGDVAAWATIPNGSTGAPAWSNGTTYGAGYAALGSDTNTYQSIAGGNIGHDPTLDLSHTYWRLVPATGVVISSPIVYPAAGTVLTADGAGNSLFQPATGAVTKAAVIATGLAATDIAAAPVLTGALPAQASVVTQGLYARTQPLPGGFPFLAKVRDPNQLGVNGTGRIWGLGNASGSLGWTDDDGATFTASGFVPTRGLGYASFYITKNYMWVTTGYASTVPANGEVYRCAAPDANGLPGGAAWGAGFNPTDIAMTAGTNTFTSAALNTSSPSGNVGRTIRLYGVGPAAGAIYTTITSQSGSTFGTQDAATTTVASGGFATLYTSWVKVWDAANMAAGPGGTVPTQAGTNATLRNSSFAIDPAEGHALCLEYGVPNAVYQKAAFTDVLMGAGSNLLVTLTGICTASEASANITVSVAGAGVAGAALSTRVLKVVQVGNGSTIPGMYQVETPASTAVSGATATFPSQTYSAAMVVGGPSLYHSANPTAAAPTWTKVNTWTQGKHGHAVKIIGPPLAATSGLLSTGAPITSIALAAGSAAIVSGTFIVQSGIQAQQFTTTGAAAGATTVPVTSATPNFAFPAGSTISQPLPWVTMGDIGVNFPDTGVWIASSLTSPTAWGQYSNNSPQNDGSYLCPINMIPAVVQGQRVVVMEADDSTYEGPLIFASQSRVGRSLIAMCKLPAPYTQSQRCLTLTPQGNWMWLGTGEQNARGPTDCVWMAASQNSRPILLEDTGVTNVLGTQNLDNAIVNNGYCWFGTFRCVIEKLIGQ